MPNHSKGKVWTVYLGDRLVGSTTAMSFQEACDKLCKEIPYYDSKNLTVFGRKLKN